MISVKKKYIFLLLLFSFNYSSGQNKLFDSLTYQLQTIERDDQFLRIQIDSIIKTNMYDSSLLAVRLDSLWKSIRLKDSENLVKVTAIIDKYGWLGPVDIGDDGNTTLFIVIQHADLKTQQKYLPLMREAVQNGKADIKNLAYLEDRVALRENKNQIYGTQIFQNVKTNECFVLPLEDPYNVDSRRAKVGLSPLSIYMMEHFKMKWDVTQYFKDLLYVQAALKKNPI